MFNDYPISHQQLIKLRRLHLHHQVSHPPSSASARITVNHPGRSNSANIRLIIHFGSAQSKRMNAPAGLVGQKFIEPSSSDDVRFHLFRTHAHRTISNITHITNTLTHMCIHTNMITSSPRQLCVRFELTYPMSTLYFCHCVCRPSGRRAFWRRVSRCPSSNGHNFAHDFVGYNRVPTHAHATRPI